MVNATVLLSLLPLVLAALLIVRGVRGTRIGNHPLCRRCGFDLFGTPAGTAFCAECGADLRLPNSILIGHRRRRSRTLIAGITVLIPSLVCLVFCGWAILNNTNWLAVAPTGWLISRAGSMDQQTHSDAMTELIKRIGQSRLSNAQSDRLMGIGIACEANAAIPWDQHWNIAVNGIRSSGRFNRSLWCKYLDGLAAQAGTKDSQRCTMVLADLKDQIIAGTPTTAEVQSVIAAGLAYQGDLSKAWNNEWGDVLETLQLSGLLSVAQLDQYAAQSWKGIFRLGFRDPVSRGEPIVCVLRRDNPRCGSYMHTCLKLEMKDPLLTINGQPVSQNQDESAWNSRVEPLYGSEDIPIYNSTAEIPQLSEDRINQVRFTMSINVGVAPPNASSVPPLSAGKLDFSKQLTLQPANTSTVTLVTDTNQTEAMHAAVQVGDPGVLPGGVYVFIVLNAPPRAAAFDVFVRADGKTTLIGSFAEPAGTTKMFTIAGKCDPPSTGRADIILRSSYSAAARSADVFTAWKGDLFYNNLTVTIVK